jgi:hypothetical protein
MTMQVGMVGTDGVLIASDTQWTNSPRLRMDELWAGGRTRFNAHKVVINHERGIAVPRARGMETASHVANEIITNLSQEEWMYPISAIEALGAKALVVAEDKRDDAQCLIALVRPVPQLFLFQFGALHGVWGPICHKMQSIGIAGDNLNSAIFWAEKYYKKLPVEQLVPLAAHLIGAAHKLNNATISGLEIVLCTPSGIRRLSDESIHALELKTNEWDKSIGELFLNHRQHFIFAPNMAG